MTAPGPVSRQGTLPEAEIGALLEAVAGGEPWRDALTRLPLPTLSVKRHWFVDAHKADFYRSLPAPSRELAIDIGPGSGIIAAELGADYRRVLAVEHDPSWSRFVRRRFMQDQIAGAHSARGDALALPCREGSADLVVLNGVLEWVPDAAPERVPREAQLACLREIHRALRPGGSLGIAIENRWYFLNFLGFSPHAEPRFAAIMPRVIANRMSLRQRGKPYRTWIYGAAGYRRLLGEAGFEDVVVRGAMPTYHEPRSAVPLADRVELRRHFSRKPGKAVVFDLLGRLGLLGQVVHSFYISARRGPITTSSDK